MIMYDEVPNINRCIEMEDQNNVHLCIHHSVYSLFQKKRTFNSYFYRGPPGGGGSIIHMVDDVNGSSTHAQFFFGPPSPGGGTEKFGIKRAFLLE